MTCIAYKEGTLAYDTMAQYGTVKVLNDIKAFKLETPEGNYLVGTCGSNCPSLKAQKVWFQECLEKVKPMKGFKFQLLVVTPEGTIQNWDHEGNIDNMDVPFYAIGAGQEYAMGAMAFGASAVEACEVAIRWSTGCGGEVRVL